MAPPKKVYEKRKRGTGNTSKQLEPKKLTPKKKSKTQPAAKPPSVQPESEPPTDPQTAIQPDTTPFSIPQSTEPQLQPTPTPQPTAINRTSEQIQPIPFPNLEATPESVQTIPTESRNEPTTADIMQMIREIDEGIEREEGNENVEELVNEGEEGGGGGLEPEIEAEGEAEPYDESRFSSKRAEKDFGKNWSRRSVIVERGMNLNHFRTEEFGLQQNFKDRGWTKWAEFKGIAISPIVQEFYANMTGVQYEGQDCILTKVRGVNFKIYPKDVRKFFGLKEEKQPQFPFSAEEALDKDALAKVLTGKPTAEWGHKKKLAKNRLNPKFNSLHFLACSQINPAMNTSEISYERGLLLYAIDQGLKVELGQIIWDNIAALMKTRKGVSGLPFAGFITKFVCKKGVVAELGEQVAKPPGPITASSRERSASHKKAREGATLEEFMEKMHEKWDEVRVTLGEIENSQGFIKEKLLNQDKRIEAMETKLDLLISSTAAGPSSLPSEDPPHDV